MSEKCEHRWVKNGTRRNRKSGLVQRWVCAKCRKPRKDYEHDPAKTLLQALALLAMRLSLDQAEYLTCLKSENISKHLASMVADLERRVETGKNLSQLGVSDAELDYLRSVLDISALTNRRLQPAGPNLNPDLAKLRRRIESVIGCEVVIGRSRQGVRVCRKTDFIEFVRKLRKLPIDRLATAKRLSPNELKVLRQLRTPNAGARLLSKLESPGTEIDPVSRRPLPPQLTMKSLADGLNMEVETLTGIAVALMRKLRRLTGADETVKQQRGSVTSTDA